MLHHRSLCFQLSYELDMLSYELDTLPPGCLPPAPLPRSCLQAEFDELGRRTEGFSGSDVSVVVKDVLMQPVRKTQASGAGARVEGGGGELAGALRVVRCTTGEGRAQQRCMCT